MHLYLDCHKHQPRVHSPALHVLPAQRPFHINVSPRLTLDNDGQ